MLLLIEPQPQAEPEVLIRCDECGCDRPFETAHVDRAEKVWCAPCWSEMVRAVLLQDQRAAAFQLRPDDCEIIRIFAGEEDA